MRRKSTVSSLSSLDKSDTTRHRRVRRKPMVTALQLQSLLETWAAAAHEVTCLLQKWQQENMNYLDKLMTLSVQIAIFKSKVQYRYCTVCYINAILNLGWLECIAMQCTLWQLRCAILNVWLVYTHWRLVHTYTFKWSRWRPGFSYLAMLIWFTVLLTFCK